MNSTAGFSQRTRELTSRCREAYDKYEFHAVYHML